MSLPQYLESAAAVRSKDEILAQFPERDMEGHWEISPDADSRWRAAVLEVLLDIRELFVSEIARQQSDTVAPE